VPTGAAVIVAALEDAGVEVCFGLPGVHNLALWEALRHSPIRLVGVRHEQAAAYAADGYARATGRLGVAITTTGPGAANTLGADDQARVRHRSEQVGLVLRLVQHAAVDALAPPPRSGRPW